MIQFESPTLRAFPRLRAVAKACGVLSPLTVARAVAALHRLPCLASQRLLVSDKLQFVAVCDSIQFDLELSNLNGKLKEPLIKYREAVETSSPGLPSRLPWVSNSNPPQPRWGCVPFIRSIPNVAAERQRWARGRYRFAV